MRIQRDFVLCFEIRGWHHVSDSTSAELVFDISIWKDRDQVAFLCQPEPMPRSDKFPLVYDFRPPRLQAVSGDRVASVPGTLTLRFLVLDLSFPDWCLPEGSEQQ